MLRQSLITNNQWAATILRITVGVIVFMHGTHKLGTGFAPFVDYMASAHGMPYLISLLVVLIEIVGAVLLIVGLGTRVNALLMFGLFIGIIATEHWQHGFWMNWFGTAKGEGYEYHLLVLAMLAALLVTGGGKLSVDKYLTRNTPKA